MEAFSRIAAAQSHEEQEELQFAPVVFNDLKSGQDQTDDKSFIKKPARLSPGLMVTTLYTVCWIQRHTTKWHSSQDVDERIIILSHIIWTKQFKKLLLDFKILSDSLKQIKQKRLAWKYMRIHVVIFWEKSCNIKRFNTLL